MNQHEADVALTRSQARYNNALAAEKEADNKLNEELPEFFGIGFAVKCLSAGARLSRVNWNGPDQYIEQQNPDEHSKMTLPYLYISTVQGDLVPWLASQTDILATDWYVAAGPAADDAE